MTPNTHLTNLDRDRILEIYRIVFTGHEALFDDLVHLASVALNVPVAYFALMTEETHWIKAGKGIDQLATPSLEARVHGRLGLRADVRRIPVFGLGCAGAGGGCRSHCYAGWFCTTAACFRSRRPPGFSAGGFA